MSDFTDKFISKILTQYRESPKLIALIQARLNGLEGAINSFPSIEDFDIDTATGDQLTIVGKILGFPRQHCVRSDVAVFGFGDDDDYQIAGIGQANSTWLDLANFDSIKITISDDEVYRKFLKVRVHQNNNQYDPETLEKCAKILFGDLAMVMDSGHGRVVVSTGRELTGDEKALWQIYPRVLPISVGIRCVFHEGLNNAFGFGCGWGGFGDPLYPDGLPIATQKDENIITEGNEEIYTTEITQDAHWMQEFDPQPYN